MKVVVTGGAGFIGSHLVDLLVKKNYQVTVIDNLITGNIENLKKVKEKIKFINLDISKDENLKIHFEETNFVFHLAGLADVIPSIKNPKEYYKTNVNGTFNVLEASRLANVKKFIYAASASCYGLPDKIPTPETSEIKPTYPYALTKWLGEELVMNWKKIYNFPVISLRFFNVYGPRSNFTGAYGSVFGVFLAQKLAKQPFTIVGNGKQTRDFVYVNDVANAMYQAAISEIDGEIFNVGSSEEISINRICELLSGEKVYIPKRPGEPDRSLADINKIKKLLKWKPIVSIEEGTKLLLNNINLWKKSPVWNSDSINEITKDWFSFLKKK